MILVYWLVTDLSVVTFPLVIRAILVYSREWQAGEERKTEPSGAGDSTVQKPFEMHGVSLGQE